MFIMHKILNLNTMEEENTFGEMLRLIFSIPKQDIAMDRVSTKITNYDTDESMRLKPKYASYLTTKRDDFFTLTDRNGLSILGYTLLTDKTLMIIDFCAYLKDVKAISDFVRDKLNEELAFVITHRANDESPNYIYDLVKNIFRVQQNFKSFRLSVENAKLLGYRLLISQLNNLNKTPGTQQIQVPPEEVKPFQIPSVFVPQESNPIIKPSVKTYTGDVPPPSTPPPRIPPPPYPPPSTPPPPPQQYPQQWTPHQPPPPLHRIPPPSTPPPPQQYPQYQPPPPQYPQQQWNAYGGTRKNHKRHKKQMRKHASKKNRHNK